MEPYNIGPRVRAAFERSGLTHAELARRAEMNWPQLWKIMRGERRNGVSSDTIRRLSRALHVSADYLLGLSDAEAIVLPVIPPRPTPAAGPVPWPCTLTQQTQAP